MPQDKLYGDNLGPWRNGACKPGLVGIGGVGTDINKHRVTLQIVLASNSLHPPETALPGELPIACQVTTCMGLLDVPEFLAGHVGFIEENIHTALSLFRNRVNEYGLQALSTPT